MANYTKWILAGLGWAIGGPIGALIGLCAGRALSSDKGTGTASPFTSHRGPYRNTGTQQDIHVALMVLVAAVMKADGVVRRSELDYVKRFLLANYGEERGKEMLKVLQQLTQQEIILDDVCHQIKVNTDYATRYHMTDFLFGLGGADGEYHRNEIAVLGQIANLLGISRADSISIFERRVGADWNPYGDSRGQSGRARQEADTYSKDPYRVLGIDSSATDDEVRKAYRRMAMKYHPDRVVGLSEELQRNAAEQMKEINAAYEVIKTRRASMK